MKLIKINPEVYYCGDVSQASEKEVQFLKKIASTNQRKRARLCAHPDENDLLHEMLIVHSSGNYIRPHKHLTNSESFHVIEGEALLVLMDETGEVQSRVPLGPISSGRTFFYRIPDSEFHSLEIISDFFVFFEVTNGPFKRDNVIFAPWAPEEAKVPFEAEKGDNP